MLTHTAPLPLFNTLSPLPAPSPPPSLGAAAGWPNLAKGSVIWGNREFRESVGGARRFPLPLPLPLPLPHPLRPATGCALSAEGCCRIEYGYIWGTRG